MLDIVWSNKVRWNKPALGFEGTNGYGYATDKSIESLERLGHRVHTRAPKADVQIWFDQPQHWEFHDDVYKIGMHPWESTLLMPGWADIMNQCDEIWTPSPIIADWYREFAGITVPVFVYEHGVDPIWSPHKRTVGDMFKFLHVGGEASRKGAKEVMQAFRLAFPHQRGKTVELDMKIIAKGWNIGRLPGVNILNDTLSLKELVQMFHDSHVYAYPSYGEGFGLTPLQAMATGMPTVTLPAWAPYADFLDPRLSVSSQFVRTPWPQIHPGQMLKPSMDDLIDAMRFAYDNYDQVHSEALAAVPALTAYYDWDRLTTETFDALEKRLGKIV